MPVEAGREAEVIGGGAFAGEGACAGRGGWMLVVESDETIASIAWKQILVVSSHAIQGF